MKISGRVSQAALAALALLLSLGPDALAGGPAQPVVQASATAVASSEDLATWRTRAGQAHKALVLEFGAKWCGPCQVFDLQVLPQATVQRALGSVVYVHYDAETAIGQTVARGLGVIGYPTFVALAFDGREIARLQGYRDASEFSKWIADTAADAEPTAQLTARAEAAGAPPEVLLQLGRRRLKSGDEAGALQLFGRARQAAPATSAIAADADWELRVLKLRQLLRDEPRKAMVEHLFAFASGPSADAAFTALTHLGAADARTKQALLRYIEAHLDASQAERLNEAVYGCLRVSALAEAERGARRLVELDGRNARYLDTLAEVLHLRGDRAAALRYSREALAVLGKATGMSAQEQQQTRTALLRNQSRFERGQRELPGELTVEDDILQPWEKN